MDSKNRVMVTHEIVKNAMSLLNHKSSAKTESMYTKKSTLKTES